MRRPTRRETTLDDLPSNPESLRELAARLREELAARPRAADDERRLRLVRAYLQICTEDPDTAMRADAAEHLLSMDEAAPVGTSVLEILAESAIDAGDMALCRRALERLASSTDAAVRKDALERLGDLFEQVGNRRAAVESWRPAAELWQSVPGEEEQARRLYERVLDSLPDDHNAAEHLVQLYAQQGDWKRIPEVMGVAIRTDRERGADQLLGLAAAAIEAGAEEELVAMLDEALGWVSPFSDRARELERAKASALAHLPARWAEATELLRANIEAFESDDDVHRYESFIEQVPDSNERQEHKRWLFKWRTAHGADPRAALFEWAEVEEQHGDVEAAVEVWRRLIEAENDANKPSVKARLARLLGEQGRALEAIRCLGPAFVTETLAPPELERLLEA